jgi:hypothetical protein
MFQKLSVSCLFCGIQGENGPGRVGDERLSFRHGEDTADRTNTITSCERMDLDFPSYKLNCNGFETYSQPKVMPPKLLGAKSVSRAVTCPSEERFAPDAGSYQAEERC